MSAVFVYILQICKNFATIRNLEVELKNCTQDIKDLTGNDAMITMLNSIFLRNSYARHEINDILKLTNHSAQDYCYQSECTDHVY